MTLTAIDHRPRIGRAIRFDIECHHFGWHDRAVNIRFPIGRTIGPVLANRTLHCNRAVTVVPTPGDGFLPGHREKPGARAGRIPGYNFVMKCRDQKHRRGPASVYFLTLAPVY